MDSTILKVIAALESKIEERFKQHEQLTEDALVNMLNKITKVRVKLDMHLMNEHDDVYYKKED